MTRLEQIRARQAEIRTRQEAIRAELARIEALPKPPEADAEDTAAVAARSQTLADRSATVDELADEFDTIEAEHGTLETEAQPLQARADRLARVRSFSGDPANREGGFGGRPDAGPAVHVRTDPFEGLDDISRASRADVRTRAMRLLEREREVVSDDNKGHLERQMRRSITAETPNYDGDYIARRLLLTERPAYRTAWMKQMLFGATAALSGEESAAMSAYQEHEMREASRAASETSAAGGYGVPVLIDPTIIITSGAADAPILRVSRIETITTNQWKGVSSTGVVWSYDSEGSAVSDDASTTMKQPTVPVYMARGFIPYSIEVGMDYPQFAQEMARLLDQGYIDLLASQSMTGSGSSSPRGIFTALAANTTDSIRIQTTTNGSFGAPDVFLVWNALKERYRARATWVMNVKFESAIRQFATNANASAYFTVDLTADGITRINGRPTIITDYAPSTALSTTGSQNILAVGDFSGFLIAQRAGMQVEQVPILFDQATGRPSGQRGWFAWGRNGMDSINDLAFRLGVNSA